MNLKEAKLFVMNAKVHIELFGEKAFEEAVAQFDVKDFATTEYVPLDNPWHIESMKSMGYPVKNERINWPVKVFNPRDTSYYREEYKQCCEFLVRSPYQLEEAKLVRRMLEARLPYFKFFSWRIYHLDSLKTDIYLECENNGLLYVPVKALLEGNWKMILERHNGYNGQYYNRPGLEEKLAEVLSVPNSYTARMLHACMKVPL